MTPLPPITESKSASAEAGFPLSGSLTGRDSLAEDLRAFRLLGGWPLARTTLVLHFATVFGIALSNGLLVLTVLASIPRALRSLGSALGGGRSRTVPPGNEAAADAPSRAVRWTWVALGFYGFTFLLATLLSRVEISWRYFFSEILTMSALPLAVWWLARERSLRAAVRILGVMVVAVAIYGILQYSFSDYGGIRSRIPGPFPHYMTYSGILLLGDLLFLPRLLRAPRAVWLWVALGLIHLALVLTLTRHAWIGAFVAGVLVVSIRWRRALPWFIAASVLLLAVAGAFVPRISERVLSIGNLQDGSNYDRLCMLWSGLRMIEERPLFGSGPDSVALLYPIYRHPTAPSAVTQHLHNTFLQLAAERGILALLSYFALMGAVFSGAWRRYRREGGWRGPRGDLLLFTLLVVIVFNLAGLFEANWRDTEVARVVLLAMAIPVCLDRFSGSTHSAATGEGRSAA